MCDALAAWCPPAKTLEQQLNASFAAQLPKAIKKRRWRLAIDLNLRPYDGQAHRRAEARYRRQAKSGTTPFHAYATGYLVHPGRPYPVALTPGEQGTAWVEGVKQRWPGASRAGVPPSLLLRDRGCYRVAVIRYPQAARYPCLMPVIGRGRKPLHPQGPSGTQGFAGWKRRGGAPYPWS